MIRESARCRPVGLALVLLACSAGLALAGQGAPPPPAGSTRTVTLDDALKLARANSPVLQAALAAGGAAHSAAVQARSALLPNLSFTGNYLYTQPNGTDTGVFIANNGTNEYIAQADVHQTIGLAETAGYRSAAAADALARAETEITSRGLVVTVVQLYDAVVVAGRKVATARLAQTDAEQFLRITRDLERGGEAAHADVIKAQLQLQQRQRDLRDAELALATNRNELAIVIFPDYETRFTLADDLQTPAPLPPFDQVQQQAGRNNPAIAAATAEMRQASQDVWAARGAMLPSLGIDYLYGLDSNHLATRFNGINLLGSSVLASLNVPLWNWGASESQLAAAHLRQNQARTDLATAQRQLVADLHSLYDEAQTARAALDSLRSSAGLADESLRLTTLRYQAGEATVLEVVDAQTTLIAARNAYDDGQARYHLALAMLQTLTGNL